VRRLAVLLAITGCYEPADTVAPSRTWVVAPALSAWPLGVVSGTIGRSQPTQHVLDEGVSGVVTPPGPLRLPTVWSVPGEGPARAIVYGNAAGAQAIELVEIDTGVVVWRDAVSCAGPVVGVTDEVVVCADGRDTRAVGLDGKKRWSTDGAMFIAITGERLAIAGAGEVVIVDATSGDELAHVKMPSVAGPGAGPQPARGQRAPAPAAITSDSILATCGDAGRELFAYGQDGRLVRISEAAGGPKATWAIPLDTIAGIDACEGDSVLVTVSRATGTALVALARETGAVRGTISEVRGYWPARDGSARIEVSTTGGVARWSRDLAAPGEAVARLPSLGELLAKRGDLRLVRATPLTAALLDRRGIRGYIPLAQLGAALGDKALLAGSWLGSPGETVHRIALPALYTRALRVAMPRPGVALPAELRDLPALVDVDGGGAATQPDTATRGVAAIALDAYEPHAVFAAAVDRGPEDDAPASLARFDLRTRAWTWSRADGCGPGTPVGVAVARDVVVCASRGKRSSVRATGRDGRARWEWLGDNVDRVTAAGDVVLAFDAGRMVALDAKDGHVLALFSSDDGAAMRAVVLDLAGMSMVVTAERGRVIGRLARAQMAPAWSLAVQGVVADLAAAGDGVVVALEDGDAYRVDARTGTPVAVPGLDLLWRATGELVTGETAGGPIPPEGPWLPPPPKPVKAAAARRGPPPEKDPDAPPELPKTWPVPPPMRASWQYTLYELTGALRARNDYALAEPITPAAARVAGAPLVVQSGPGLREMLVLDPLRGDPLRRVRLPESAAAGMAFSTIVDGKPVVGTLLANPLRVVLF
jgi:outer membrane protein assembly factor BamB